MGKSQGGEKCGLEPPSVGITACGPGIWGPRLRNTTELRFLGFHLWWLWLPVQSLAARTAQAMLAIVQLPPEMIREVGRRAKRAIRQRMRTLRRALPEQARRERSRALCEQVLASTEFCAAKSVGLFAPLPSEVDVAPLEAAARSRGMQVYYPFMDPKPGGYTTGFRRLDASAQLVSRARSFLEPPPDAPTAARGDLDVIVVPAVALAADGMRLGFGSGFYDATLPDFCPPALAMGVAFDFQLLAELPSEEHDQRVQIIVTDRRLLRPTDK